MGDGGRMVHFFWGKVGPPIPECTAPSRGDGGGRYVSRGLRGDSTPCLLGMEERMARTPETEETALLPKTGVLEGRQRPNTEC